MPSSRRACSPGCWWCRPGCMCCRPGRRSPSIRKGQPRARRRRSRKPPGALPAPPAPLEPRPCQRPSEAGMNMTEPGESFNLSKWALDHPALTRYLMVVLMLLGFAAYFQLGQDEDPPFTFRAMVVRTNWPGATAQQVAEQVTDKLERVLQEAPYADKIRSYSKPGESQIIFQIKDSSRPAEVANVWYTVRKKIGDMRFQLPAGIQ